MKVFINSIGMDIFTGARVEDALLKYSGEEYQLIMKGDKILVDGNGNELCLDGELSEGECLFIEKKR